MKKSFILATVAVVLTASQAFAQNANLIPVRVAVDPTVPSVTLTWDRQNANLNTSTVGGVQVFRRDLGVEGINSSNHNFTLLPGSPFPDPTVTYIDTDVERGKSYEYRIRRPAFGSIGLRDAYIATTVDAALEDQRGTVLFVVDETLPAEMEQELQLAEMDMVGDGWDVKRMTVPQHISYAKLLDDTFAHMNLKERIVAEYNKPGANVKALYLFGRVPVAKSGSIAPDGHSRPLYNEFARAHETDAYYGDMHDEYWTDTSLTIIRYALSGGDYARDGDGNLITYIETGEDGNVPGDGKFDQSTIPHKVELMTGRVDFAKMVSVRKNEQEYLRDYIQKAHSWKHNEKMVPYRMHFALGSPGEAVNPGALQNMQYPMTAPASISTMGWDDALPTHPHLMGSTLNNTSRVADTDHKVMIAFPCGSWRQQWYSWDNQIRAALTQAEWGLAAGWGARPSWLPHLMAAGKPTGYMWMRTANNRLNGTEYATLDTTGSGQVHINLMGDPTVRLVAVPPARNLRFTSVSDSSVTVIWTAAPTVATIPAINSPPANISTGATVTSNLLGYHVYRSVDRTSGYKRLTDMPILNTTFTDTTRSPGRDAYYQVRAVYLTKVPTGTYENQAQGAFNILRANGTSNKQPVADAFQITATRNVPTYLSFGGMGTPGETLTPIVVKNPEKGQIRWSAGKAYYVSNLTGTNPDSVTYRLWDGLMLSDPVTIPITVVVDTDPSSKFLLGWQFTDGSTTNTTGSTRHKTGSMLASTLTLGSTVSSAPGTGYSNKAFSVTGTGTRSTEFDTNSYIEWKVSPATGNWQSLERVTFFVFGGNLGNGWQRDANPTDRFNLELRYSTDNFATSTKLDIDGLDNDGKFNAAGAEKNGGGICSARLADHAALQGTTDAVQFRLYVWNVRTLPVNPNQQIVGLGKSSATPVQNPFDIAVLGTTGTVQPASLPTVTFDANGATSGLPPAMMCAATNSTIALPKANTLAMEGHVFIGWNTLANGRGTNYIAGANFTITGSTTLYAVWTIPTLTVTPETRNALRRENYFTFQITSNVPWSVTKDTDWLNVSPRRGSGNATVYVHLTDNPGDVRNGTVTVEASGDLTSTIAITQATATNTYKAWAQDNQLEGSTALPTTVAHNDGITNLTKYALGLDGSQATDYTETGYYTTDTVQSGKSTLLVFTYAFNKAAEGETAIVPSFSKNLQNWQPVTPKPVLPDNPTSPLRLFKAEGDFSDGKGFFRLEIEEK